MVEKRKWPTNAEEFESAMEWVDSLDEGAISEAIRAATPRAERWIDNRNESSEGHKVAHTWPTKDADPTDPNSRAVVNMDRLKTFLQTRRDFRNGDLKRLLIGKADNEKDWDDGDKNISAKRCAVICLPEAFFESGEEQPGDDGAEGTAEEE